MIHAISATVFLVAVATAVACAWVDGWNRGYEHRRRFDESQPKETGHD